MDDTINSWIGSPTIYLCGDVLDLVFHYLQLDICSHLAYLRLNNVNGNCTWDNADCTDGVYKHILVDTEKTLDIPQPP